MSSSRLAPQGRWSVRECCYADPASDQARPQSAEGAHRLYRSVSKRSQAKLEVDAILSPQRGQGIARRDSAARADGPKLMRIKWSGPSCAIFKFELVDSDAPAVLFCYRTIRGSNSGPRSSMLGGEAREPVACSREARGRSLAKDSIPASSSCQGESGGREPGTRVGQ